MYVVEVNINEREISKLSDVLIQSGSQHSTASTGFIENGLNMKGIAVTPNRVIRVCSLVKGSDG